MKAIVLAAGYATRMYPLTKETPKPLLTLGTRTILDHIVKDIAVIDDVNELYIVSNEKFIGHFQKWHQKVKKKAFYPNLSIFIISDGTTDNDNRLGAIADIQFAIEHFQVDDDTLVIAGDNVFKFSFLDIFSFFKKMDAGVIAVKSFDSMKKLQRSGIVEFDQQKRIIGFEEKPEEPRSTFVAPAFYILKQESLPLIKAYLDQQNKSDAPGYFISWLIERRPLYAFEIQNPYYDIGTLEAYQNIQKLFTQSG
jgi:glucose-1-phosphate thymidylyltransferase